MIRGKHPWRHAALLISILLLIIISPIVASLGQGVLIVNIAGTAVLLAGSFTLRGQKPLFIAALCLSVLSVATTALMLLFPHPWTAIVSHSCDIILISFFAIAILLYVLRAGRITMDKIFAAICVYLLVGYAWSFAYALLEDSKPGSFKGLNEAAADNSVLQVMQFRYYSYITLTTVGYGDISPVSPAGQTMAILEAIMGQFYLAVLVARLVGLQIVDATTPPDRNE
jgi:hypothetical protein